ncbi:MAG TPA: hypothetical protein PLQ03_10075 [Brevundimonas sp.]|uniref:NtrZ family periplasmic regulatory protein n=1 Tax=Brevundimonas sp. TaxID=1871086 RepID=UPI0026257490|nr:hypothetical protein [Brevundimonas sp.]HRO33745.1 hypothetical protein [Brevundimonas sp.]
MRYGVVAAAFALAGLIGFADVALAQSRATTSTLNLSEAAAAQRPAPAPTARRSLRWIDSGRWGVDLNMNQPVGRETEWGDVQAGAYYRLSPRFQVGASAGLATPRADPARAAESDRAPPRVRLESIFKF